LLSEDKQKKDLEAGSTEAKDESYVLKLLVHKFLAGCIIGKAGAIIKQITQDTGARIQVSNEPLPGSAEKSVTLTGTPTATHQAILRVLVQIRENPMRPGSGGALYVPGRPVYGQPPSPFYAPPPGYPVAPYGPSYPPAGPSGPEQTQKIAIPTICAGSVIGKGGTIIADIKAQSGCQIRIADPEQSSPNERVVTVTGTPAGIQTAVYLIRQRVEQPYGPPPGGFAGDSAGGGGGAGDSSQKNCYPHSLCWCCNW